MTMIIRAPSGLTQLTRGFSSISAKISYMKKNNKTIEKITRNTRHAIDHFDSLYGKVYGRAWPSMRLGLLSAKKQCAVLNTFTDTTKHHNQLVDELAALDLQRYYKKHLHHYIRSQLREELLANKRARKRELMAKNDQIDPESIDLNSVEVSDVSDSELKGIQTTDGEDGSFSTAEDLQEMFSDRRMDDDEKYFINKARVDLSLEDFVPATELIFHEEMPDELKYYDGYQNEIDLDIEQKIEPTLEMSDNLKVYAFPRGSWSRFDQPTPETRASLFPYYLLDGASILPVLALDLKYDDICADYCSAPGGKSLAMLMTMKPKYLLANDVSKSRLGRMRTVIKQFLPDTEYVKSTLELANIDARKLVEPDRFDKILVDAPCSNDRHSVESIDNIFKRQSTGERLSLPSKQSNILRAALKSVRPKGCVVYSTCTMSPIENDGVVQRTLSSLRDEGCESKFAIMDLKEAFRPFRGLFKFNTKFKYGQQVVPNICSNFGPMYISKVKRIS